MAILPHVKYNFYKGALVKSKYFNVLSFLHKMSRTDLKILLSNADLTKRERDILLFQEFEKIKTIKEIAFENNVEERQILRSKQKALGKIGHYLDII